MKLIQVSDFNKYAQNNAGKASTTIGNFDGCHLGHQKLVAKVTEYAARFSAAPIAITFNPRPDAFFRGHPEEPLLFTSNQKTRCLGELGIEFQIIQNFDAQFSQVSHRQFFDKYLLNALNVRALVVGDDFRFGHKRLGNLEYLTERAAETGIELSVGQASLHQNERISSSRIRQTIAADGDMNSAAIMLGRPYMLEGKIEKGDQLGRQLGFPTANLGGCQQLIPKFGVYVGYVWLERESGGNDFAPITRMPEERVPAVLNVGVRPSVGGASNEPRIEAHLLKDDLGPDALYGLRASYYVIRRLRDEIRFASLLELQHQIRLDVQLAKKWLEL